MRPDVDDLQAFYGSRQGQLARRLIRRQIRRCGRICRAPRARASATRRRSWPLAEDARAGVRVMPAGAGRRALAAGRPSRAALAREDELPLADGAIDAC